MLPQQHNVTFLERPCNPAKRLQILTIHAHIDQRVHVQVGLHICM